MNHRLCLLILFIGFLAFDGIAQSEGISPSYSFSIKKKIEPPLLEIVPGSVQFVDSDGNHAINANEQCKLIFDLKNSGTGDGLNLFANLVANGTTQGLKFSSKQSLVNVVKNQTQHFELSISSDMVTQDGVVTFKLVVEEPNGFNSDAV
jgi:hypothetical protein